MNTKKLLTITIAILFITIVSLINFDKPENLPLVAIANYGPHSSLEASIAGIKEELARRGFIEHKTIKYEIVDVGFDASLIPQMITGLKNKKPKVMVVMTTPIAQFAKGAIKDIPLIYNVITDPVEAGLIKEQNTPNANMTGSSDRQDLKVLLNFAKKLIPHAQRVGLLYATAEANDIALLKMMEQAAKELKMEVVSIPVDQARDVQTRMQKFKDKVDFIYVGTSGPIQPTLPVIAAEANKMRIPVLNVDEEAVKEDMVLASFGVDYKQVGVNAGKLVVQALNGIDISQLKPAYPTVKDHHGFISMKKAKELGLTIPDSLTNVKVIG